MDWFVARAGRVHSTRKGEGSSYPDGIDLTPDTAAQTNPNRRWAAQLQLQQGRTVVWLPVSLVCGLMAYYSLPVNPPLLPLWS